jgi:hypothetical protein
MARAHVARSRKSAVRFTPPIIEAAPPPKLAPMPELLGLCTSTTNIRRMLTTAIRIINNEVIVF